MLLQYQHTLKRKFVFSLLDCIFRLTPYRGLPEKEGGVVKMHVALLQHCTYRRAPNSLCCSHHEWWLHAHSKPISHQYFLSFHTRSQWDLAHVSVYDSQLLVIPQNQFQHLQPALYVHTASWPLLPVFLACDSSLPWHCHVALFQSRSLSLRCLHSNCWRVHTMDHQAKHFSLQLQG